jgi:1,4-dihydroxy-2-naphthoyl-CoA hydrolase
MPIWQSSFTLDDLMAICRGTADEHVGLEVTGWGDDWLEGTLPLDTRTQGESGELHPGSLAIVAEALGSIGANLCVDQRTHRCLGQSLSIYHPLPVTSGPVRGRASPRLMTPHSQIWKTDIWDATGALVCISHLTMIVLEQAHRGASSGSRHGGSRRSSGAAGPDR